MRRAFALALVAIAPALAAQERPKPFAVEASGILPVDVERRVVVDGLAGDLVVQVGKPGEIRFQSLKMGRKDEIPVALYEEREAFVIRPTEGEAFAARTFQMAVPPDVLVRVQAPGGGKLTASGLRGGLEITGRSLNVDARGLACDVDMTLEGGAVVVSSVQGGVRVRGRGTSATLDGISGQATLALVEGAATVRGAGGLDADLDGVVLKVERVTGPARVVARGGSVELAALAQGADLDLAGSSLVMSKSKGDITVSSDAEVRYKEMEADLHLDVYGGSVRGSGNQGIIEVRTRNAAVTIEKNVGPVRVQGDGLELAISDVSGETVVLATVSNVSLENIGGAISVENDRGDLVVTRATQAVQAKVRGGNVRMIDVTGPVDLTTDGDSAEVSWASIPDKDSRITNEGGEVVVRFPATGTGCRVEARSKSGRVETNLPRVRVLDGGSQAQGWVGNAQRPTVYVDAERDVHLLGGSAPAAAASE